VSAPAVLYDTRAHIAWITINSEPKRNAISLTVLDALMAAFDEVAKDPDIRAVVLTGVGERAFSSGVDLDEVPEALSSPDSARFYDERVSALYRRVQNCNVPVVARMNGHAIGGGALLSLACDLRIATDALKIAIPVAKVGLMLSPYEYRLLLEYLTPAKIKQLIFASQVLDAATARQWGLLDFVVPAQELDRAVSDIVRRATEGAPLAIQASKKIVNALHQGHAVEQTIEVQYQSVYTSRDLKKGLASIRLKQTPVFEGR